MPEFDLIKQYFASATALDDSVLLGIGDDAAVLQVPENKQLVVAADSLVAGIHFPHNTSGYDIGHKALAVNLSDLAAMGAQPKWFTLAISAPPLPPSWWQEFTCAISNLAKQHQIMLIGGDTTASPVLTISIQILGLVAKNQFMRRDLAKIGDIICVSANLGDAGLGLAVVQKLVQLSNQHEKLVIQKLNTPIARVELGQKLVKLGVKCAIDISDGLAADLGHILDSSGVGASVFLAQLPLSASLRTQPIESAWQFAVASGDDYELCFTVAADKLKLFQANLIDYYPIGRIESQLGLRFFNENNELWTCSRMGYEHFT
jgi:thiamine-monophosphate kinase